KKAENLQKAINYYRGKKENPTDWKQAITYSSTGRYIKLGKVIYLKELITDQIPKEWLDKDLALALLADLPYNKGLLLLRKLNEKEPISIDFMKKAIEQQGEFLSQAVDEIQHDKQFILTVVKKQGYLLKHVPIALSNDKEIVLAAVKQNGTALQFTSPVLQVDEDVVLAAVMNCGMALEFALKQNREIVVAAVKQYGFPLLYAADEFKKDREIVLRATKNGRGMDCSFLLADFQNDKEVMLNLCIAGGKHLSLVPEKFRKDRDFVLAVVKE